MGDVLAIPLHLAVHVSGFGLAAGLAAFAVVRRNDLGTSAVGLLAGAVLLGLSSLVLGAHLADGMAWPVYVRAAGFAGIAIGVVGRAARPGRPVPAIAAVGPAAPVAAHVVAAGAAGLAALAVLGGSLGRGRIVALLAAGLALLGVGDLLAVDRPVLAAGASILGAALGLAWLVQRAGRSLTARFVSSVVAVLLIVVLGLASAAAVVFDQELQDGRLDRLGQQAQAQAVRAERQLTSELTRSLALLAGSRDVPAALVEGRASDGLAEQLAGFVPAADVVVLIDGDGRPVGSFDRGTGQGLGAAATLAAGLELVERTIERSEPLQDLVRAEIVATVHDGPELLAVATRPLFPRVDGEERRDRLAGVVVAASRVARADRLDTIARELGVDVAIVVDGQVAGATGPVDSRRDADLVALASVPGPHVQRVGDVTSFAQVRPITTADGATVGHLVLVEDASVVADLQRAASRALFLAAVLGVLLASVLATLASVRATRPVRRLTTAAERIAEGDLDVRVEPGSNDEVGRLAGAFGVMAAALREREQELMTAAQREAALRERLEAVTSSMDDGLLAVDQNGQVLLANPAAERLLAADPGALVGEPLDQVLVGDTDTDQPWPDALGLPGSGDVRTVRGRLAVNDRTVTVAATVAPLQTDDGQPGRVVVLRDVTAEAEMARARDEFVSNAAHELRTPLTPVVGYLDTLRRRPDLPTRKRNQIVADAATGAQRLRTVVDQLVRYADLQVGRARVEPVSTDVSDLVDEVLERWRHRAPDRTFRRRVARGLPQVLVDPDWTHRALDELVDNAVKFSSGTVVVAASREADGRVRLEVRDKGSGIDPAQLDLIRQPFEQADGSTTRAVGGLGLGLAVVERIAWAQEATLVVESGVGQGAHVGLVVHRAP
jgi:two-component system, OmpR family, sensor histidine kinase ResE